MPVVPAGVFGIVCGHLSRYTEFSVAMSSLVLPQGGVISWNVGALVGDNCNNAVRTTLDGDYDWLLLMGDDHKFHPDFAIALLRQMYRHDLDVIAPLCLMRKYPFWPVVYTGEQDGFHIPISLDQFEAEDELLREVYAAGTAGMIVRRRVLEVLEPPYFKHGTMEQGGQATEDLQFCADVRAAGFKLHCDLSVMLGHITQTTLWPRVGGRTGEESWGVAMEFYGGGRWLPNRVLAAV